MLFYDCFASVLVEQATSSQIAHIGSAAGRVHDIGEKNSGQYSLKVV